MPEDKEFVEKVIDTVTEQFTSGEAAKAHDAIRQRHNRLDEINRQLEEGDDPNQEIFEKDPFAGRDFDN